MLRTHALALPLLLVLTLAGCGSPPAALEPEPTAEELAYDEALAVYTEFNRLADIVAQAGGYGSDVLADVATGQLLEEMHQGFDRWRAEGISQIGFTVVRGFELWDVDESSGDVIAALCEDLSGTDIVDRSGTSIVGPDRVETFYSMVIFERTAGSLRIESRSVLDGREC